MSQWAEDSLHSASAGAAVPDRPGFCDAAGRQRSWEKVTVSLGRKILAPAGSLTAVQCVLQRRHLRAGSISSASSLLPPAQYVLTCCSNAPVPGAVRVRPRAYSSACPAVLPPCVQPVPARSGRARDPPCSGSVGKAGQRVAYTFSHHVPASLPRKLAQRVGWCWRKQHKHERTK